MRNNVGKVTLGTLFMLVLFGPFFLWVVSKIAGKSELIGKLWAKETSLLPTDAPPATKAPASPKA
jgi:hypothetical protein